MRLALAGMDEVYPRVCGGTAGKRAAAVLPGGLSPRVRGNQAQVGDGDVPARSIPACAGEPDSRTHQAIATEVYPRVCGGTPPG